MLFFMIYIPMAMASFVATARMMDHMHNPWIDPGPFAAGLLWPIGLPFVLATLICHRMAGVQRQGTRLERKQKRELSEAQHRKDIARINAETLAIQEREAGIK